MPPDSSELGIFQGRHNPPLAMTSCPSGRRRRAWGYIRDGEMFVDNAAGALL